MLLWLHAYAIASGGCIHEPLRLSCREQAAQARAEADTVREFSAARAPQNSKRPRGPAEEHILAAQAASKRARIEARYLS